MPTTHPHDGAGASAEDDWDAVKNKMAGKIQKILDDAIPTAKEAESEESSAGTADT